MISDGIFNERYFKNKNVGKIKKNVKNVINVPWIKKYIKNVVFLHLCRRLCLSVCACVQYANATGSGRETRSATCWAGSARASPTRTVVAATSVSAATTATRAVDRASATAAPTTATVPGDVCRARTTPAETTARGNVWIQAQPRLRYITLH